jgi:hypothetical protein
VTHERGRGDAPGSSAHYWTLALLGLAVLLRLVPLVGLSLMRANDDAGSGQGSKSRRRIVQAPRQRFEERDARQIGELTEDARRIQEDLAPVLKEMSEFLPADRPPAE